MNRIHVHLNVRDLEKARRFYTAMFGAGPTVAKPDYLKWRLDDPAVNLSVVADEAGAGLMHLGLDCDSAESLDAIAGRLALAGMNAVPEAGANCCYARSDKQWLKDPADVTWEAFHTFEEGTRLHGADHGECCGQTGVACCG